MPGSAIPRFLTPVPEGLPTWAPRAEVMARALQRPAMPWQRDLFRIGCTLNAESTAMLHRYVVCHVPRRAGKTAGTLAAFLHRCATGPTVRTFYTAQTRADAALTFRDDWTPMVESSPVLTPGVVKIRRSNGSEGFRLRGRGSLTLFAPGPKALHGQDADVAAVDEAWAFSLDRGGELEGGILPAQLTRPFAQMWIVSAGGTSESTWLARWMQLARDGTPGVALLDFGAEDDDDTDDPEVWARVHPAVGHTMTLDGLASLRTTMDADEFRRAVMGVWTPPQGAPAVIPREAWAAALDDDARPEGATLTFGVETSWDGTRTYIVAAAVDARGRLVVEVVDEQEATGNQEFDTAGVVARWRRLRHAHRARLYADELGPTAPVVDALRRARLPVEQLTTAQYATACATFLDLVTTPGAFAHRGQPLLDESAARAAARAVGDRWVWQRKGAPAAPIIAATCASYGALRPRAKPTAAVAAG